MTNLEKMYQAIHNLRSGTELSFKGDIVNEETFQTIDWHTGVDGDQAITTKTNPHPELTWSAVDAEMQRLQAEYDAQDYARLRKAEYPSIEEAVHAILDDDLENLQIKRTAVKEKYPK